jgi:hypothetical protein
MTSLTAFDRILQEKLKHKGLDLLVDDDGTYIARRTVGRSSYDLLATYDKGSHEVRVDDEFAGFLPEIKDVFRHYDRQVSTNTKVRTYRELMKDAMPHEHTVGSQ